MDQPTSPQPYPNPYAGQPPVQPTKGSVSSQSSLAPSQPSPTQARTVKFDRPAPQAKTNWLAAIILLIIGLLVGGVAGYFIGDLVVFQSERDTFAAQREQLEQRITVLESQATSGTTTTTPGTTTQGTGTAPTQSGITPDPTTANWSTYSNTQYKFSFKYPADYQVTEAASTDENVLLEVGVFRTGSSAAAAMVRVYKGPNVEDAPTTRDITAYAWPDTLPTGTAGVAAGAGVAPGVTTTDVILNGTSALRLEAVEGKATTPTPGGKEYSAYFVEDVFSNSYLIGTCTQGQTEEEQVACALLTTFTITR